MKGQIFTHVLICLLWLPSILAGVPKIEDLDDDEVISISVLYTEPGVTEYKYVFAHKRVSISQNGKNLGNLAISAEDSVRIDQYLKTVERGKKIGRTGFGHPVFSIDHTKSGKLIGSWGYRIEREKESRKPVLSLWELKERIPAAAPQPADKK